MQLPDGLERLALGVRSVLRRMNVRDSEDDLVQDAWVVALESGPSRGVDTNAWFRGVATNLARRHHRSEIRRARREERAARLAHVESTQELVLQDELRGEVRRALGALPRHSNAILVMRYYEGMSSAQIAGRVGLSVKAVEHRLRRARQRIGEHLSCNAL